MDYGLIIFLVGVLLFVVGLLLFGRYLTRGIERDISCAVQHQGSHTIIRTENQLFTDAYGDTRGTSTTTILWCSICKREIQTSWSDESWVAIANSGHPSNPMVGAKEIKEGGIIK